MDGTMVATAFVYGIPILAVVIVITVYIVKQNIDTKRAIQRDIEERKQKEIDQKNYFEYNGCVLSKRIGNLLIDNQNKKWMIAGTGVIYNYSDVTSVRVREENNFQAISLYIDIGINDVLNPLIIHPIVTNFPAESVGNINLYVPFKNISIEQEAFFKAIIADNKNLKP